MNQHPRPKKWAYPRRKRLRQERASHRRVEMSHTKIASVVAITKKPTVERKTSTMGFNGRRAGFSLRSTGMGRSAPATRIVGIFAAMKGSPAEGQRGDVRAHALRDS